MSIEAHTKKILEILAKEKRDDVGNAWVSAIQLQEKTGFSPADINDAIEILHGRGLVSWLQTTGTAPFKFMQVTITALGRYGLQSSE